MKIIGKNRWEAVNWLQEALGPATPRNVAEDTFVVLLREGIVEDDIDEMVLLEDLEQDELRNKARNTIVKNDMRKLRNTPMRRGGPSIHKGDARQHRHAQATHTDGEFAHRSRSDSAGNSHQHQRVPMQQLVDDTMADVETPVSTPDTTTKKKKKKS